MHEPLFSNVWCVAPCFVSVIAYERSRIYRLNHVLTPKALLTRLIHGRRLPEAVEQLISLSVVDGWNWCNKVLLHGIFKILYYTYNNFPTVKDFAL